MAFTGVLGTKDTQPGSIVLGSGPAGGVVAPVADTVTVSDVIAFDITQGKYKRLTETITVTSVTSAVRDLHPTVTSSITVTSDPEGIPGPFSFVTQMVTEVIYTMTQKPTITQFVVEVVYKKATAESITDSITVTSTPGTQFRSVRMFVTDSITVGQTLNGRDSVSHQVVTDTILVTPTVGGRGDIIRQVLMQSITVTPAIIRKGDFRGLVTDSITVTPSQPARDNTSHDTVTDSLTVAQSISAHNTGYHLSVTDTISVTQTIALEINVKRVSVTDSITVSQDIFGRNTIVRLSVTTSISVSVPTVERDQLNHQSTSDSVLVTDQISEHSNPVHMSVTDTVHIITGFPNPVFEHVTPIRMEIVDAIAVTTNLNGGSSERAMTVSDHINVNSSVIRQQIYFNIDDAIAVSQVCWAGNSRREMSVTDSITVTDANFSSSNPVRMAVADNIIVTTVRTGVSPTVKIAMTDFITIFQTIGVPTTYRQNVLDVVVVDSVIGKAPDNNRQTISDHLTVTEGLHFSPVSETVTDTVSINVRITTFDVEVRHNITVSTNLHKNLDVDITDSLTATQTVGRQMTFVAALSDTLTATSLLSRAAEWGRAFTDVLHIYESDYPKTIDFLGDPIFVPVAVGTLVSNHFILRSPTAVITLPTPQLGNELANVAGVQVQRSMNAKTLVFKQSSTRQKLRYLFRLDRLKAFELRKFVTENLSVVLNLETWDGQIWVGYLIDDPFSLQNAGRSTPADEYSTVELNFEGTKLSG